MELVNGIMVAMEDLNGRWWDNDKKAARRYFFANLEYESTHFKTNG